MIKLSKAQQRIFDFIVENGSITTLDAFIDFGETRLSARIYELKEKGVQIKTKHKTVKNRFGEIRHVNEYYI